MNIRIIAAGIAIMAIPLPAAAQPADIGHPVAQRYPVEFRIHMTRERPQVRRPARHYHRKPVARRARAVQAAPQTPTPRPRPVAAAPRPAFCEATPARLDALSRMTVLATSNIERAVILPASTAQLELMTPWDLELIEPVDDARAYLVRTATPGGTMTRQTPDVAIGRLHPVFAVRLAAAIREARANGLPGAGVFSAFRSPGSKVGGFKNKFDSMHAVGLAVDMRGIGRSRSAQALQWYRIAGRNKLFNPYGPNNRAEFNHYQPTFARMVPRGSDLRATITAAGPKVLATMWRVAERFIRTQVWLGDPPRHRAARHRAVHQYARHHRRARLAGA